MKQQSKQPGAKPTHRLYVVTGSGESANWTQIGAAWPNKDGNGFTLTFEALPLSGRVVMRVITEKAAEEEGR